MNVKKPDLSDYLVPGSKVVLRTRLGANPAHDDIVVAKIVSDRFWAPGNETVEFGGLPTYNITDQAKTVDGIVVAVAVADDRRITPPDLNNIATGRMPTRHERHGTLVRSSVIVDIAVLGGHEKLIERLYLDRARDADRRRVGSA